MILRRVFCDTVLKKLPLKQNFKNKLVYAETVLKRCQTDHNQFYWIVFSPTIEADERKAE